MSFFSKMFGSKIPEDKTDSEHHGVDLITALAMHIRGDLDPAFDAYQKISTHNPVDTLAPFFTAAIQAGNGNTAEAAETLRSLSMHTSLRGENISKAVSLELFALVNEELLGVKLPPVAEIIVSLGDLLKGGGFVQESAVCYEVAVGLVPDRADVIHKFGDTLHDLHLYDYAESVLLEALKLAPFHWGALYTYAVLLQDLGRNNEAIDYYQRALKIDPNHAKSHNNYGAALMRAERLDEALEQCTLAAELDPDSSFVNINLGNIYVLMQEYEKARGCFTKAIALDENNANAFYGLASVEHALHSDAAGIRDLFLNAITLNPSVPEFHHALGNFLAENGNPEALEHFAVAAQLNGNLINLHKDFGIACFHLGQKEGAVEHLQIALQQSPDDAKVQEMFAKATAEIELEKKID